VIRPSRLRQCALALFVAATLAFAPAAYGQNVGGPTEGTYAGEGPGVAAGVDRGADPAGPQTVQRGALPFTGLDMALLALGGAALALTGAGLARVIARPTRPTAE
jgi:hypothetical protein